MYAYGNHIRVRRAEADLNTCDSGIAAMFSQDYRASVTNRNMRSANLEYIGWVEEIIGIDYGKFELLVLYFTWVKANMRGVNATMKHDTYGFTLIRPNRCIWYSSDSFAFPLYMQQVFFVDDVKNLGWKVVLRKEAKSIRVASESGRRIDVQNLSVGRDDEHPGLTLPATEADRENAQPDLRGCAMLDNDEVHRALAATEQEPEFEEECLPEEDGETRSDDMYN
jgi:hypothetical protein